MNRSHLKMLLSFIILVAGAALSIYGFTIGGWFHIFFGGGIAVIILAIVLYIKRTRWGYWWAMLTGKKHIETFVHHDAQDYDSMNREPNLRRGRALEKIAVGLIWIVSLGGQILMPFLGFELMAMIAAIAVIGALCIFIIKKILAYYEFKEHATERHVILDYVDLSGNDGELFFEDAKFSKRLIVDADSLVRVIDSIDKQLTTMRTERTAAGEAALKQLPDDIREMIEKVQKLAGDPEAIELAIKDRIKASTIIRRFYRVGIDQDVDFDYTEEETIRRAVIAGDEKEEATTKSATTESATAEKNGKKKSKKIMPSETIQQLHKQSSRHLVCRLCGEPLIKSEKDGFFFKCSLCNVDTNSTNVLDGPVYEPHTYMLYPGGSLKRRCILIFPVKLNDALDPEAKLRVRFNYESFMANAHYIRTIKIGPLKEVLYDGEYVDGIPVELPDGISTLDSEVPVFIATDFDYAEKRRLAGLQMVKPPALIEYFIRLVKAIIQVSIMGRKLEDKEIEISKLHESRHRIRAMYESLRVEREMDQPTILPDVRSPESQQIPKKQKPLRKLQALGIAIIFFGLGALATWFALPALGWTVIPPEVAAAVTALLNGYSWNYSSNAPRAILLWSTLLFVALAAAVTMFFVDNKKLKLCLLGLTCLFLLAGILCFMFIPTEVIFL